MTWWLIKEKNGELRYSRKLPKEMNFSSARKLHCDWCDKEADRIISFCWDKRNKTDIYLCQEHWEEFNR